jgi:hydroxymethylbilane synthase
MRLIAAHGLEERDVELSVITTSGDRIQDKPLREFGGKGMFTKEIDEALLDARGPALAAGSPRGRLPRQCRDPAQEARSRLG